MANIHTLDDLNDDDGGGPSGRAMPNAFGGTGYTTNNQTFRPETEGPRQPVPGDPDYDPQQAMIDMCLGGDGRMNSKFNDTFWSYNLRPGQGKWYHIFLNICCPCLIGPLCSPQRKRDYMYLLMCSLFWITLVDILYFLVEMGFGLFPFDLFRTSFTDRNTCVIFQLGGKQTYSIVHDYQLFRLVTPIFMHASFIHIGMNMFVQLSFGLGYERNWTFLRMVPIYFLSGIFGNLLSACIMQDSVGVGASGAIFGVLFAKIANVICAFGVMNNVERCAHCTTVITILFFGVIMSFSPNVDWAGHLGGAIMGGVLGFCAFSHFVKHPKMRVIRWCLLIVPLVIALLLFIMMFLILFLAVTSPGYYDCQL